MGLGIGVDFGLRHCTVAVMDGARPKVLENRENRPRTRSVVSLKKRKGNAAPEILVGDLALDNWPFAPSDTIIAIRRLLGRSFSDPEVQQVKRQFSYEVVAAGAGSDGVRVKMGGKEYAPADIAALLLKKLKDDAEFRLGEPLTDAAIAVPAYFLPRQRDEMLQASLQAGLQATIVEEPVAAAVAFGVAADASARTILVYDLGGSSFDTSILAVSGDAFSPLTLAGDLWLGGDSFDQALADHVLAQVKRQHGFSPAANDPKQARFMAGLARAAEETRERLCSARSADLIVAGLLQDGNGEFVDVEVEITREEFEAMIRPLVEHSVKLVMKALDHARLETHEIDLVLLAGAATRVPLVRQALENVFGAAKVRRTINPDQCVALGAAMLAAAHGRDARGTTNVPFVGVHAPAEPAKEMDEAAAAAPVAQTNYGARLDGDKFTVLIAKGDPYPTPVDKRAPLACLTRTTGQRSLRVPLYGGDNLESAGANEKQGEVLAILPPGLPAGTRVYVMLWLNDDGMFGVSAALDDGTALQPWIMRSEPGERAADAIGKAERLLAEKGRALPSKERKRIEGVIVRAYEELKKRSFDEATRLAAECEKALPQPDAASQEPPADARDSDKAPAQPAGPASSGIPAPPPVEEPREPRPCPPAPVEGVDTERLKRKAGNLVSYVEVALKDYGWAFPARQASQLSALIAETHSAVQAGDPNVLARNVAALDKASDQLPPVVRRAIGLRVAILVRVKPVDSALADELLREMQELEKAFSASGAKLLAEFGAKLAAAVKNAEKDDAPAGQKCLACGAELKGERYCLACYDERWSARE